MPKRKPKAPTFASLSSNLSKGELGWLKQMDPFNLNKQQEDKSTIDLAKLQQWITNRNAKHNGAANDTRLAQRGKKRGKEYKRPEKPKKPAPPPKFPTAVPIPDEHEYLDNIDDSADDQNNDNTQSEHDNSSPSAQENPQPAIMVIDLLKHGFEKLIVGKGGGKAFTLTEPVVIRARTFSKKAKEIIEEQGGICIEISQ